MLDLVGGVREFIEEVGPLIDDSSARSDQVRHASNLTIGRQIDWLQGAVGREEL